MKKLLAILTVMTMVLTTLVVPTVAFGLNNGEAVTCDFNIDPFGGYLRYEDSNGKIVVSDTSEPMKKSLACSGTVKSQLISFGIKEIEDPQETTKAYGFEGWYRIMRTGKNSFAIDFRNSAPALYETSDVNEFRFDQGIDPTYVKFVAKWESIPFERYEQHFVGNGGSVEPEGPLGPGIPCTAKVGDNEKTQTLPQDSPLEFECDPGDAVTLSVDVSAIPDFAGASFTWFKFVFPTSEGGNPTEIELPGGGYTYTVSDKVCAINGIPEDDIDSCTYVCRISTTSGTYNYRFSPCTEVFEGGPSYEISANQINIYYWFYDMTGFYNFFPVPVTIGDINPDSGEVTFTEGDRTLQSLVNEYGSRVSSMHCEGLELVAADSQNGVNPWSIDEMDGTDEIGNIGGGFAINVHACYENDAAAIQTILSYYDKDGKKRENSNIIILENARTTNNSTTAVYNKLVEVLDSNDNGELDDIEQFADYGGYTWSYPEGENLFTSSDNCIRELKIKADYDKQPVEVSCTYYDANGKVVTKSGRVVIDSSQPFESEFFTAFNKWVADNNIPTNSVKGWAFNSRTWDDYQHGNQVECFDLAAMYMDKMPVYADKYHVKYDVEEEEYYSVSEYDEVVYVNVDATKAFPQTPTEEEVRAALVAEFSANPIGALVLNPDDPCHIDIDEQYIQGEVSSGFYCVPHGIAMAQYDKILVEFVDDQGVRQELVPQGEQVQVGNEAQGGLWNVEGTMYGGAAIPGGTFVNIDPPFVQYSLWKIQKDTLNKVPEGLKHDSINEIEQEMDDEIVDGTPWNEDSFESEFFDITLLRHTGEGQGSVKLPAEVPVEGIWITFDYPEGTDKNTEFVISHMFTENHGRYKAGDVEIITKNTRGKDNELRMKKTDRGIKVLMYSLSPISVAYGDALDLDNGTQGGTIDPGNTGNGNVVGATTTPDKAVDTGDDFSAIPYIAVMAIALAGVAGAIFRRRSVK